MEQWSNEPLGSYRIKFFLDTNILSYLVGNTYSGLNIAIEYLKGSQFADLVSSKYVIFEFIDVRKKTLYIAEVNRIKGKNQTLDPNVIVRYKEHFEKNEVDFHTYKDTIKNKIELELKQIVQDLDITCDENILHDNLLAPTKEINLFSKVSREDSLILVSSIWPEVSTKEDFLVLITRDKPFVDSYNELNLNPIFNAHGLQSPLVEYIESMKLDGNYFLNVTESNHDNQIPEYLNNKIKELILLKNKSHFLGKTIPCGHGANFPTNVVCFRLPENTDLNNNLYLTIIGKDLDFIYSIKLPVTDFFDQVSIVNYPLRKTVTTDISFRPMEEIDGTPTPIHTDIVSRLRETGNLVFINTD
jgi:hypothetical protein